MLSMKLSVSICICMKLQNCSWCHCLQELALLQSVWLKMESFIQDMPHYFFRHTWLLTCASSCFIGLFWKKSNTWLTVSSDGSDHLGLLAAHKYPMSSNVSYHCFIVLSVGAFLWKRAWKCCCTKIMELSSCILQYTKWFLDSRPHVY